MVPLSGLPGWVVHCTAALLTARYYLPRHAVYTVCAIAHITQTVSSGKTPDSLRSTGQAERTTHDQYPNQHSITTGLPKPALATPLAELHECSPLPRDPVRRDALQFWPDYSPPALNASHVNPTLLAAIFGCLACASPQQKSIRVMLHCCIGLSCCCLASPLLSLGPLCARPATPHHPSARRLRILRAMSVDR